MVVRTKPPKTFSPAIKSFPLPEATTLRNGIQAYSYNMGSQPVFKLEIIIKYGSANLKNPLDGSIGINLLREGTKTKSAEEINKLLAYYGSFLELKSNLDFSTITLYGRSEFLKELILLLSEILSEPAFKEVALTKHKALARQNLEISKKKTSYWSARLLRQAVFGELHAYSAIPDVSSIDNITPLSIARFQEELLANIDSIIIAGNFDQDLVNKLLDEKFGEIQIEKSKFTLSAAESNPSIIEKRLEQTNQASIAVGARAISHQESNYPLHSFIVKILGGYFGSRLMKTLREDRGLTYGINAYYMQLFQGSYLQISSDVKLEAVHESIDIIKEEIEQLLRSKISENELNTVKNYMLGEFVNDTNTAFDYSSLYRKIILYDLPANYYDQFYKKIGSISLEEVEYEKINVISPEHLIEVKVY